MRWLISHRANKSPVLTGDSGSSELPPKPAKGGTCNGCGLCCYLQRCHFSVEIFGAGPGPCPALESDDSRAWCGVLRNPSSYFPARAFSQVPVAQFQVAFAAALAIGVGCDSDDDAVAEFMRLELPECA